MGCSSMKTRIAPVLAPLLLTMTLAGCSHTTRMVGKPVSTDAKLVQRIILYGDGGKPKDAENASENKHREIKAVADLVDPVLKALHHYASDAPERTAVLYLGDNIYENGMPPEPGDGTELAKARAALTAQIVAARDPSAALGAQAVFLPGNHDWRNKRDGIDAQSNFIKEWEQRDPRSKSGRYPAPTPERPYPLVDGVSYKPVPGEWYEPVDVGPVRVIVLDTGYLLPKIASFGSDEVDRLVDRLKADLGGAGDRHVLVVAHHPLLTHGPHGGYGGRLLPWGWFVGAVRKFVLPPFGLLEGDLRSGPYQRLIAFINRALDGYEGAGTLIFAAGHEHSLQVLDPREHSTFQNGKLDMLLVSGSGSKITAVKGEKETYLAKSEKGFMTLDFYDGGQVQLTVVQLDGEATTATFMGAIPNR